MMPMAVGGCISISIAHHRPRVLRSDDDSLPKLAVVIPPVVAIRRDGDETHLVLLVLVLVYIESEEKFSYTFDYSYD